MTAARRFLVLQALMLWQGGFVFYAAVVVPVGTRALGSATAQGRVTSWVSEWLNLFAAAALVVLACDTALTPDPRPRRVAARWWCWAVAFAAQYLLFVLHPLLVFCMNPARSVVLIDPPFAALHGTYLWALTVQWAAMLVFAWLTVRAWAAAGAEPRCPADAPARADLGPAEPATKIPAAAPAPLTSPFARS